MECGAVARFDRSGPKGEIVCPACGVVYPKGVYPEPAPAGVSGDAYFRTGHGRVLFEVDHRNIRPLFFMETDHVRNIDARDPVAVGDDDVLFVAVI